MLDRININTFLEDLTYNCAYTFLEEGSKELNKIANKRGISLPCHDLAIFKCVYAFVDRQNLNGCTLPKDEVEKSLQTLVGKAVDFDHLRQKTVGYWIDAELEKDSIVAYGIFFKSNLADDYITIKDLMEQSNLKISFEAYGMRHYTSATSYELSDIEFCGGALLIATKPAFADAGVLEMANKERVLEMASIMTAPETFIKEDEKASYKCSCIKCGHEETSDSHCMDIKCSVCGGQMRRASRPGPGQGEAETARMYVDDMAVIERLLLEINECPACGGKDPYLNILNIDFENDMLKVKHNRCESIIKINLEPTTTILKKGKRIKDVKLEDKSSTVDEVKQANLEEEEGEIIDMEKAKDALVDTIKDNSEMRKVKCVDCGYTFDSDVLAKSTKCEKCGGRCDLVSDIAKEDKKEEQSEVKDEIKEEKVEEVKEEEKVEDTKVDEKSEEKVEEVIEKITEEKAEEKKEEKVEEVKEKVEEVKEEVAEVKEEVAEVKEEEKKEEVKEDVAKIKTELANVIKERDEYKAQLDKIEEAKKAETIKSRRDELGEEVAKDVSDEDILDEKSFKILKLEKENKELKKDTVEDASLEVGSSKTDKETPNWKIRQAKVNEIAYGKENKEE